MVRFGGDSRIKIKGKGSIKFILKGGDKKVLSNVYYIPGLRSNIVSLGQTTEAGCKVSMKEDVLKLLDRSGQLMIKCTRSKNRLYIVILQADILKYLQITATSEFSKWHARLGHLNDETMKMMMNRDLVVGIPKMTIEKKTCVSFLLGKQTGKPFPQSTSYRATVPLELVHGDLCGPITPHSPGQKRYIFCVDRSLLDVHVDGIT